MNTSICGRRFPTSANRVFCTLVPGHGGSHRDNHVEPPYEWWDDPARLCNIPCTCVEIMKDDPSRHFKGCPSRALYPTSAVPVTLADWQHAAFENSDAHGWHEEDGQRHRFPERCMLMVSEIVELFEGARSGALTDPCDKPIALSKGAEEAADIFIRLADFCAEFKIDLEHAVRTKHAYNQTRSRKHGGKHF